MLYFVPPSPLPPLSLPNPIGRPSPPLVIILSSTRSCISLFSCPRGSLPSSPSSLMHHFLAPDPSCDVPYPCYSSPPRGWLFSESDYAPSLQYILRDLLHGIGYLSHRCQALAKKDSRWVWAEGVPVMCPCVAAGAYRYRGLIRPSTGSIDVGA